MDNESSSSGRNLVVALFSDSNFLGLSILENLLTKNCFVNIVTGNVSGWLEKTSFLSGNKRFSILDKKTLGSVPSSYSIIILGYGKKDPYDELSSVLEKYGVVTSKALVLLPFEKYSLEGSSRFNLSGNLGVIYLGDLLGARMDLENDLLITRSIREIYLYRSVSFPVGEVLYPLFAPDAAKTITRWLFSFGPYGKETLLLGSQASTSNFWKENVSLVGEIKIESDTRSKARYLPKGVEIKTLATNLKFALTETYKWLAKEPPKKLPKVKVKKVYPKYVNPLIMALTFIFLLPMLLLLLAAGTYLISYKQFIKGSDGVAENLILVGKTLSVISKQESRVLSYIPLVGIVYRELFFAASLSEKGSEMAITSMPLVRSASDLVNKILGNDIYDPAVPSTKITEGLDALYREISLLQVDTGNSSAKGTLLAKYLLRRIDFDKFKYLSEEMKKLSQNLSEMLGKTGSKSYLVLFQNNMELRPTGGFIGSFGILTFDGGRISDLTINDVYSADGQLNGHVEPPTPIKKYLGEANWWLRDSNWDPDFPTSAMRAEWFLDKETGRSVDGVIAIDLTPIKNILKHTGPIFLPDFNMDITSENLYEKTQAEVQEDFFPGTHKKASFLTALSRSLLADVSKLGTTQKLGILSSFYNDLEARSIQIFLHDDGSQSSVSALRWDGGVITPDCGQQCYPDIVGTVEANLGVNKTNFFIERSQHLEVSLSKGKVIRTLELTLKNNANLALGASGVYKTYVRLLSRGGSKATSVQMQTGAVSQEIPYEVSEIKGRNETGVYLEILGGQTKTIKFTWVSDVVKSDFNRYGVYLRKQAGTGPDPVFLTVNGITVYNGLLAGDIFSRVDW